MATKCGRPMMSMDLCEARRRARTLYRAFYRAIPYIKKHYDIERNEEDLRWKLREYFYKNAFVNDMRVIDILVIKGYIELQEVMEIWQQKHHIAGHWQPTIQRKPCDFVGKFINEKV